MKEKSIFHAGIIITTILLISLFLSCKQIDRHKGDNQDKLAVESKPETKENLIVGDWTFSEYFSGDQLKTIMGNSSDNAQISATMEGSSSYYSGGTGKGNGTLTFHFTDTESQIEKSLIFTLNETTTWVYNNNKIIEITVDAILTPDNDLATMIMKDNPTFADQIRPLKGETTVYTVLNLTPTLMELEEADKKLKVTYHKKQNL